MRTARAVCAALLCAAMVHAAQVKVKISSEPAGATIRVGSETCTGSCVLAFEKGSKQTIVATKEGFEEAKSVQTMQRNGQKIVVKLSPKKPTVKTGVLKDKRDGRAYKTVQVEDDWWMAENLAFNVKGASVCAGGNCKRFGRLYDWAATMDLESDYLSDLAAEFIAEVHQGVCPDGWHVPSEADWSRLIASGDGMQTAGEKLTPDGKLPGPGAQTLFWSARESAARDAQSATLRDGRKELTLGRSSKGSKNAVRCIQDRVGPPPPPKPKPVAKPEPKPEPKPADKLATGRMKDKRDGEIYRTVQIDGQWWTVENMRHGNGRCFKGKKQACKDGKAYGGEAAQKVCPAGWHLPTREEWESVQGYMGPLEGNKGFMATGSGKKSVWIESAGFWTSTREEKGKGWYGVTTSPEFDVAEGLEKNGPRGMMVRCVLGAKPAPAPAPGGEVAVKTGTFKDKRDGRSYATVVVGNQEWMAENLAFHAKEGSYCYEGKENSCKRYGRLYNWNAAMEACPADWHVPTDEEWERLKAAAGDDPGRALKARSGWKQAAAGASGGAGSDALKFGGMPSGLREGDDGTYARLVKEGDYWSSTPESEGRAWYYVLSSDDNDLGTNHEPKQNALAVRCVRGPVPEKVAFKSAASMAAKTAATTVGANEELLVDERDGKRYKAVPVGNAMVMAQNLDYASTGGSWCYEGKDENCEQFGRLYDWATARDICPAGWHLPTSEEWKAVKAAAAERVVEKLRSATWNNGQDEFGFNAKPAGYRYVALWGETWNGQGSSAYWWSSTATGSASASAVSIGSLPWVRSVVANVNSGYSVRCFKDSGN